MESSGEIKGIKVFIGESSRMSCQLISEALKRSRNPRFEVEVPHGFTSSDALRDIERTHPDVAIISNALEDGPSAGFSLLRALYASRIQTRSVLLFDQFERRLVVDAFRSGARGVLSRAESLNELCKCIQRVHWGQIWASTKELEYVLEELSASRRLRLLDARGKQILSPREEEVAALVADGLTNKEVAVQLRLSEFTVKNYIFKIFEKLGISTRVELVLYTLGQFQNTKSQRPQPHQERI
jgi:DNA-binding NarL/FixJ family response regulator